VEPRTNRITNGRRGLNQHKGRQADRAYLSPAGRQKGIERTLSSGKEFEEVSTDETRSLPGRESHYEIGSHQAEGSGHRVGGGCLIPSVKRGSREKKRQGGGSTPPPC